MSLRPKKWGRLRGVPLRRRLRVKVGSWRKVWMMKKVMLLCSKVKRRFKEGHGHFGDLFAGNYVFTQINPTSLKYLQNKLSQAKIVWCVVIYSHDSNNHCLLLLLLLPAKSCFLDFFFLFFFFVIYIYKCKCFPVSPCISFLAFHLLHIICKHEHRYKAFSLMWKILVLNQRKLL